MMKKLKIFLFVCFTSNAIGQSVNFQAYSNITDNSFMEYVSLFENKTLPVSTESLFSSGKLSWEESQILSDDHVNDYLKANGDYVVDPVYIDEYESGEQQKMYGHFIPIYKLPTNGDYVMLLVLQDDDFSDFSKTVWVIKYDLSGNFISFASPGWLINDGAPYINCTIDEDLKLHYSYLYPAPVGGYGNCQPCTNVYQTVVYQMNSDASDTEISFNQGTDTFEYCSDGYFVIKN